MAGEVLGAIAAPISAGISYLGDRKLQKENQEFQREANAQNFQFAWDMYERQRKDALSDWNMANQYNSLEQQMARLKQAGLNPHLVYGKGAETTAAMVRSATGSPGNSKAYEKQSILPGAINAGMNTALGFASIKQTSAQTDNLHAQKALIAAQTLETLTRNERGRFELGQLDRLKDLNAEVVRLQLEKTKSEISNIDASTNRTLTLTPIEAEKLKKDTEFVEKQIEQTESNIAKTKTEQQSIVQDIIAKKLQNEQITPIQIEFLKEQVNQKRLENGMMPLNERMLKEQLESMDSTQKLQELDAQLKKQQIRENEYQWDKRVWILFWKLKNALIK